MPFCNQNGIQGLYCPFSSLKRSLSKENVVIEKQKKKRKGRRRKVSVDQQIQGLENKIIQKIHAGHLETSVKLLREQDKDYFDAERACHEARYADLIKNLKDRGIFEKVS